MRTSTPKINRLNPKEARLLRAWMLTHPQETSQMKARGESLMELVPLLVEAHDDARDQALALGMEIDDAQALGLSAAIEPTEEQLMEAERLEKMDRSVQPEETSSWIRTMMQMGAPKP